jgi:hypothetical protein
MPNTRSNLRATAKGTERAASGTVVTNRVGASANGHDARRDTNIGADLVPSRYLGASRPFSGSTSTAWRQSQRSDGRLRTARPSLAHEPGCRRRVQNLPAED